MPGVLAASTAVARRWRRWRRDAAVALACAACAACGEAPAATATPDGPTVVLASGADLESGNPVVTLHPMARQVQRHALFVTLARYDSALVPQPYYARRWSWSVDRRRLTFALEPSLRWHDGTPTTARDVAFTLEVVRDPATASPRAAELGWLVGVEVRDDTTITLVADRPLATLPGILCELPIVPAHRLRDVPRDAFRRDRFATAPLGNGPFVFVERTPGERWVFSRNASFPASMGGAPGLARVIVAVVDEATTKFAALVSGEVDVAGISPTMAQLVERDRTLAVRSYPVLFSYALVFNATRPPFDDVRVRRGVSLALDRARLVDVALAGFGTPATTAVPPGHPLAADEAGRPAASPGARAGGTDVPDPARADSATAARWLDEAGWRVGRDGWRAKDGRPLRFTLSTVGSGDNALEQLIQADLRRVGIAVEIRQRELGAFLAEARAERKTFDALVTGIPGDLALSHLAGLFDGAQRGGALDYTGRHLPALDRAFAATRSAATDEALRQAWRQVQSLLADEVPVAWLYHARGVQGVNRRLRGVRMDLRGELATLARWSVDDAAR